MSVLGKGGRDTVSKPRESANLVKVRANINVVVRNLEEGKVCRFSIRNGGRSRRKNTDVNRLYKEGRNKDFPYAEQGGGGHPTRPSVVFGGPGLTFDKGALDAAHSSKKPHL